MTKSKKKMKTKRPSQQDSYGSSSSSFGEDEEEKAPTGGLLGNMQEAFHQRLLDDGKGGLGDTSGGGS